MSPGRHHDDPRDVRLEDPRDLPCIAGHLKRHPVVRREALREQLQVLRSARYTPPSAAPAAVEDRDLAEVAMHIQPDRSHHYPLSSLDRSGELVGKRHRRIRARSATGHVARGGHRKVGLTAHRARTGLPNLRSPRRPLSQSREPSHRPGHGLREAVSCPEEEQPFIAGGREQPFVQGGSIRAAVWWLAQRRAAGAEDGDCPMISVRPTRQTRPLHVLPGSRMRMNRLIDGCSRPAVEAGVAHALGLSALAAARLGSPDGCRRRSGSAGLAAGAARRRESGVSASPPQGTGHP